MSEIKALDKLRKLPFHGTNGFGTCVTASKEAINSIADRIEAEIAERFMELPVDADGIPIHVGDRIEYPNGERNVVRFITVNDNEPAINESGWFASKCHHIKPRTIEDVIRDAVVYGISVEDAAEEIRGMMADDAR